MAETEVKKYSMDEVRQHVDAKNPWIVIHDSIYDVAEFLADHPGGEEVLLEQAGKDSTEEFEDVGHSSDAREVMQKYKIGELIDEDRKQNKKPEKKSQPTISSNGSPDDFSIWKSWLLPLTIGVLAIFVYRYFITS
ncbi:cytochrome b5 isoform X2 [Daktulosphaira vitifoliae]|uniref:cytochrome b5 isoform X2 n=1 Tax=Daktulosphaira vitifoliae TaxID=58002 RepID=UPI0021A9F121|nr:cytochrome b5 isoform X2 [Daktulosphaira vitifoliae]